MIPKKYQKLIKKYPKKVVKLQKLIQQQQGSGKLRDKLKKLNLKKIGKLLLKVGIPATTIAIGLAKHFANRTTYTPYEFSSDHTNPHIHDVIHDDSDDIGAIEPHPIPNDWLEYDSNIPDEIGLGGAGNEKSVGIHELGLKPHQKQEMLKMLNNLQQGEGRAERIAHRKARRERRVARRDTRRYKRQELAHKRAQDIKDFLEGKKKFKLNHLNC